MKLYGTINITARDKHELFSGAKSWLNNVYRYNQIVEFTDCPKEGGVKWYPEPNNPKHNNYYFVPNGCYDILPKEKYPEYYL